MVALLISEEGAQQLSCVAAQQLRFCLLLYKWREQWGGDESASCCSSCAHGLRPLPPYGGMSMSTGLLLLMLRTYAREGEQSSPQAALDCSLSHGL